MFGMDSKKLLKEWNDSPSFMVDMCCFTDSVLYFLGLKKKKEE